MTIATFQGGDAVTMTSLELVDFINNHRKGRAEQAGELFPSKGFAKLEHADFLKKVPEVLGGGVGNFSDTYVHPQNGQTYPCYRFPKRESCLMAMSYSYDLQAAVFDYMTELEQRLAQQSAFVLPRTRAEALRLAADLEEQNEVLALENQQQAKKIDALENLFMPGETVPQFAKRLNGVNSQQMLAFLIEIKWVYNAERDPDSSPKYRVYAVPRDKQWLTEKPITIRGEGILPFIKYTPVMLEEGARRLHDMYLAEKLPMKQTWDGSFTVNKFTSESSL